MSKIKVSCDCGQTFKVPPTHLGRKLQCKRCGQVVRLLAPADSVSYLTVEFSELKSGYQEFTVSYTSAAAVPLPAALPMLGAALGGLGLLARRRRRRDA